MRSTGFRSLLFVLAACGGTSSEELFDAPPATDGAASDALHSDAAPLPPTITAFVAQPAQVGGGGGDVQLAWNVVGADTLAITANVGSDPGAVTGASLTQAIDQTTTYTLVATNTAGTTMRDVTVEVTTIGEASWRAQVGTAERERGEAVAVDADGNVYVAGSTRGNLFTTLGGEQDGYVIKYSSAGAVVWSRHIGTAVADFLTGITVAPNGDIYVAGSTLGAFPGVTARGVTDAFVVKLSSSGDLVWARQFGSSWANEDTKVALDASGNVYAVTATDGTLQGATNQGFSDLVLAKYSASGTLVWERQFGTSNDDLRPDLAVDANGDVYISSTRSVAKVSSAGTVQWTTPFIEPRDIAVGPDGRAYITGATLGLPGETAYGGSDAFVAAFSPTGTVVMQFEWGTASNERGEAIALDRDGYILVGGAAYGALSGQVALGDADAFIAKFGRDEGLRWVHQFGTSTYDDVFDLAVDQRGNAFVTGTTQGALPTQTSRGGLDSFVARYR